MSEDNLNKGFIRLSRHIFDGRYWEDSREFSKFEALLDLIKSAEYKKDGGRVKYKGNEIKLKRGQLFSTLRFLQERWNWTSRGKVDKFLKALEKGNTLETEKKHFGNILTLVNYDVYNPLETERKQKGNTLEANPRSKEEKNVIYFDNAEVNTTYLEFLQMRKEIKKPATETAIKKQIKMLNEFSDKIKLEIINKSIMNNYLGLFKPKGGDTKKDSQFFPNGKLRCI